MNFTIEKINDIILTDNETKKKVTIPGWAFIDEQGHTLIQIYGVKKKNLVIKILKS